MVRAAAASEYLVKLRTNLPSQQSPHPIPAATFDEVLVLCSELQAACGCYRSEVDSTEETVKRMQATNCYYVVARELGTTKTCTQQALFHRMSASTAHIRNNSGRARKAKAGKHLPRASSIAKLEQHLGKSLAADVFQVLFLALADPEAINSRFRSMLDSLSWESREPIEYLAMASQGQDLWADQFDILLPGLTTHVSMGTLGGAVLLFRLLLERGQHGMAKAVAYRIFQALLMLGPELQARGIAAALFSFCLTRLFPQAGLASMDTPEDMARMSTALSLLGLLGCANPDEMCCWQERRERMHALVTCARLSSLFQFQTQLDATAREQRARAWGYVLLTEHTSTPACTCAQTEPCTSLLARLKARYPVNSSLLSPRPSAPAPTRATWCSDLVQTARSTARARPSR